MTVDHFSGIFPVAGFGPSAAHRAPLISSAMPGGSQSGRLDSNQRPPDPQSEAPAESRDLRTKTFPAPQQGCEALRVFAGKPAQDVVFVEAATSVAGPPDRVTCPRYGAAWCYCDEEVAA